MSKVLLVDDEPSIRLTISEFLKRAGYEALTSPDYDGAMSVLSETEIDVAIVDINLPRRSGIELLQELHRCEPYIPVIMITGEPRLSQMPELVRAGAYDFIAKPVLKDAVINAVARAIEKKHLIDDKRQLEHRIKLHAEELEGRVAERTTELAEAYSFLNLVLDSPTEYAIIVVDIENRVTLFNRGAELMFGYTAEQAIGRMPRNLFVNHERVGKSFLLCAQEAEATGRYQIEINLHRADKREFTTTVAMTPVRHLIGETLGYLCIIRDLTVEREREESLRQMQAKLANQEKIAALGQMAAQVAHEIKNPLAGLLLYSMHLKKKASGQLADSELAIIGKIIDTVNHLTNTTEQIVNFARPVSLILRPVDFNNVLIDVLQLLEPQILASEIEKHFDLDRSGIVCLIDQSSMRAALMNLLLNAIEAMSNGGKLSVATVKGNRVVHLTITDTGCGMSEEQMKKVFEPFYTTKSKGLGLGMPYAQKIIKEHHGTVQVTSRLQVGTRIRIELPADEE